MADSVGFDPGKLLSSLLAEPKAVALLSSLLGGKGEGSESKAESEDGEKESTMPTVGAIGRSNKRREALLHAIRPYLKEERCQRLDRLSRAIAVMSLLDETKSAGEPT